MLRLQAAITEVRASKPGLDHVGAIENYAFFEPLTKIWLCILMVMGRLELYSILVLVVPSFWRSH